MRYAHRDPKTCPAGYFLRQHRFFKNKRLAFYGAKCNPTTRERGERDTLGGGGSEMKIQVLPVSIQQDKANRCPTPAMNNARKKM